LANYVWSTVHGIAMLALDGRLRLTGDDLDELVGFAVERMRGGIDRA
jgi:hypothetical protein